MTDKEARPKPWRLPKSLSGGQLAIERGFGSHLIEIKPRESFLRLNFVAVWRQDWRSTAVKRLRAWI